MSVWGWVGCAPVYSVPDTIDPSKSEFLDQLLARDTRGLAGRMQRFAHACRIKVTA